MALRNINNFIKNYPLMKQVRFAYTIKDDESKKETKVINNNLNLINNNEKLKKYVTDIYKYTGVGFSTSIATSIAVSYGATLINNPNMFTPLAVAWVGSAGMSFYSIYKMNNIKSVTNNDMTETIPEEKKTYYKIFSISNGITIAPIVGLAYTISPMIVPIALTGTMATFGGATYYALKQDNLNKITWHAPLMGCVIGLIGTNFITIFASFLGYTSIASQMDFITTLVSTGVFTALIVVNTQQALQDYKDKTLDTISTATNLLLDTTNLFIDLVKLVIKFHKDN